MKKIYSALLFVAAALTLTSCPEEVEIAATGITLNEKKINLFVDEEFQLVATVTPKDCTEKVVWSSSDPDYVTVDQKGMVVAFKPTEKVVKITAKVGDLEAVCKVTVFPKIKDFYISDGEIIIVATKVGDSYDNLDVVIVPEELAEYVTISIEDTKIAEWEDGKIVAKYPGKTRIIASCVNINIYTDLTVNDVSEKTKLTCDKVEVTEFIASDIFGDGSLEYDLEFNMLNFIKDTHRWENPIKYTGDDAFTIRAECDVNLLNPDSSYMAQLAYNAIAANNAYVELDGVNFTCGLINVKSLYVSNHSTLNARMILTTSLDISASTVKAFMEFNTDEMDTEYALAAVIAGMNGPVCTNNFAMRGVSVFEAYQHVYNSETTVGRALYISSDIIWEEAELYEGDDLENIEKVYDLTNVRDSETIFESKAYVKIITKG